MCKTRHPRLYLRATAATHEHYSKTQRLRRFGRGSVWYPYLADDKPMANLYFEDAEIGTSCTAGPYLVTKNEIIQFARQYDPAPRHIDEEAAVRSVFGGLTASSAHSFSIFILLTTGLQPRLHVLAGMGWNELRLPNAVRPGDELDLESTVLEKRESKSKSDRGIVRTRVLLRNQRRETVLECTSIILVARRPDANTPTRIEKTGSPYDRKDDFRGFRRNV
jgi:acyl dehydratase